jgi:hypothetical protein
MHGFCKNQREFCLFLKKDRRHSCRKTLGIVHDAESAGRDPWERALRAGSGYRKAKTFRKASGEAAGRQLTRSAYFGHARVGFDHADSLPEG